MADPGNAANGAGDDAAGPIPMAPLFPLPGGVLMPGAILPLNVFERRYRQMTRHALDKAYDGRKLITICRIREDADPMDVAPPLFEVACVGAVVDCQALPDGRYNLLLKGLGRVRLGEEAPVGDEDDAGEPVFYRRADLHPLPQTKAYEIDLTDAREKMRGLCRRPPILGTPVAGQLDKLFASGVPTAQLADVLAFDLLENADDKQRLLEETDVRRRVEALAAMLDRQFPEADSIVKLSERFKDDD